MTCTNTDLLGQSVWRLHLIRTTDTYCGVSVAYDVMRGLHPMLCVTCTRSYVQDPPVGCMYINPLLYTSHIW